MDYLFSMWKFIDDSVKMYEPYTNGGYLSWLKLKILMQ